MMKKFWTTVLGSFVGVWIALTLFSVLSALMAFAFVGAMSSISSTSKPVQDNSILHINLQGALAERSGANDYIDAIFGSDKSGENLATLLRALKEAKSNDKVKGVYIECNSVAAEYASLTELRNAIVDFKSSKKFVYAYGDGISLADYYVASAADSLFLNNIGVVEIHGLGSVTPYFKTLLDKVGVEMQVVRVGTFKSAVEPYMLTEMSEANRLQQSHYIGSIWNSLVTDIAKSRKLTPEQVNAVADSIADFEQPANYVKKHIVDALCYRSEFENKLRKLTGVETDKELNLASPADVAALAPDSDSSNNSVAVFYAVGEIDGNTSVEGIDSKSLVEDILDAANDDDVKAVVLRVNSPGGSAFGSEQIWAAFEEVKKKNKPFAVSMGDYAASGGYYISCGADRIFAEPTTLTGSIGVFGLIPCVEQLATEKLGVNFCSVHTNANEPVSTFKRMTPFQRERMQRSVNDFYELFTSRCATGRNLPIDSLKSMAEGRVWDGASALKLGLVDQFGNLESAVKWVASKAKLADYKIVTLPNPEDKMLKSLSKFMDMRVDEKIKENTGELYQYHDVIRRIMSRDHIQCLMEPVTLK